MIKDYIEMSCKYNKYKMQSLRCYSLTNYIMEKEYQRRHIL